MFGIISEEDPVCVKYLQQTSRDSSLFTLNDTVFEAFAADLIEKQPEPTIIPKGKSRILYMLN